MASTSNRSPQTSCVHVGLLSLGLIVVMLAAALAGAFGCGGGSSDSEAVASLQKFLEIGQNPGTTNRVLLNELPPGLPDDLPEYPGSTLLGSTITTGTGRNGLGVLSETGDPVDKVYVYYEQALSTAPWQIQLSTFPGKVAGIQFTSTNDSSATDAVVIQPSSDDEGHSMIFLSIQSTSGSSTSEPFKLEPSKPLPLGWPAQFPAYPNTTITDTGWGQTSSTIEWQITFLAQAAPKDVIDFYRTELTKIGFSVADEAPQGQESLLSFQVPVGDQTWSGAVSAQAFAQDPTYVQATLQMAVGTGATPSPTPSP